MKSLFSFCIISLCFVFVTQAQVETDTLFSIENEAFATEDFIASYQKNASLLSSSTETVEEHLKRYIDFQLKLKSAYALQLDTLPSFQKEFAKYYKQIADSYISNGEVTEAMVRETYERTKTEVKASHILLNLPKQQLDTLKVYEKAMRIKKRLESGEGFNTLAQQYSQDPSVKKNNGDLGWFNTFKMVYEFEDAAYQLDVGEVSDPVKTNYGYHIIKKTGERPSKGQLKTAHIMLLPSDSLQDPEVRIQKIYKRLEQGEDFHELAKQYSQDPNSASGGGYIAPFGLGGLNSKTYENVAYRLKTNGDYSQPFKSRFGWHIVKLIETVPLKPYEVVREDYKRRLKSSSRSKVLVSKIKEDLEKLYTVTVDPKAKSYFMSLLDERFKKGKWTYEPAPEASNSFIIEIENRKVDYKQFGKYLERQQRSLSKLPTQAVALDNAIDELVYIELLELHKAKLPEIDREFGKKILDYKNGILIFDYMTSQIWKPVSEDSTAHEKYYNANAEEFVIQKKIKGQLFTSSSKTSLKKLRSQLKKMSTDDTLVSKLQENIIVEHVSLSRSTPKLPANVKFKTGLSRVYKHSGQYVMMKVDEIQASRIPDLEEVRGRIIGKLQEKKEAQLIAELRNKYEVSVNKDLLQKIKQRIEK